MIIQHTAVVPFNFEGLEIRDYTAKRATSSSLAEIIVPPGKQHPEAWSRRSDKYYYVIAGTVCFMLDGEEHWLEVGDCCLVLQGHRFSYENPTESSAKLLLIHTPNFEMNAEVFAAEKE